MIIVYFETESHAEKVATFEDEETYQAVSGCLENVARLHGFTKVTESMEN